MPDRIRDTRRDPAGHVARFRADGTNAVPVIFGDRLQPEAALLPS